VLLAHNEAAKGGQARIDTEHLLIGILCLGEGTACQILDQLGADREAVLDNLRGQAAGAPKAEPTGEIAFAPEAQRVLQFAFNESRASGQRHIDTGHMLVGLLQEKGGAAVQALQQQGVDLERVREALKGVVRAEEPPQPKKTGRPLRWEQAFEDLPIASSHCHHGRPEQHSGLDLDKLIASSYVGWCGVEPGTTAETRARFVNQLEANTYFVWLSKAVAELYGQGEITAEKWGAISGAITEAHKDPEHHYRLLTDRCRYRFAVQDSYWAPGDDLGRPELFRPTYRINSWVMACRRGVVDHNGNSPWNEPGFAPAALDEYLDLCEAAIEQAASRGAVAIKSALAYDRPVSFDNPDREAAERAFAGKGEVSRADQLAFGDVVMRRILEAAQRLELPVQVHLGLGIISGSRPMLFEPMIAAYPGVTFDLFHGGYPWCDEIAGLLHNYDNVIADMCWLPLLSTTRAIGALHEYLDVARSADRIVWGDDTWTGEEAYAAVLAWRHVVRQALLRRVMSGLCTEAQAQRLTEKLMYRNAQALFAPK
jgi:hypothetical protein